MIIRKIRLTEYEYQPPINFVAGATEPDIQFQLADYTIPAGATARCYVQRFDGTFEYTVATIDGNSVTVEPTSSMFSVRGEGAIQITLYAGEEVLKNFSVPVFVHADLADENAEQGSDVTGIFRAAEEQALADFQEQAEEIAEEVKESIPADYTELTEEVSELNERLDYTPQTEDATETDSDLDVSDTSGNVLVRFEDGHIQTKYFNSKGISDFVAYSVSVNQTDSNADLDFSDENGNSIARLDDGHIKTKNFSSRAVTPKIITVKKDGSGDFTSIRSAVDSIHDASSAEKPYVIEVYPGVYNVFEDYTQAEIETAGTGAYIQDGSGFVGILLNDGISLRGVGDRSEIILHGELEPNTYVSEMRNNISTLNLRDTMSLENLTVEAKYIRYCVHDDFTPTLELFERVVKNCVFRGESLTSGAPGVKTWGEGSRRGKTTILEHCDFGTCMLWHSDNLASATHPSTLIVRECTSQIVSITCTNHSVMNNVHLYGNAFGMVFTRFLDGTSTDKMMTMDGTDRNEMVYADDDWNYTNGDIVRFKINAPSSLAVGQLVVPDTVFYSLSSPVIAETDPAVAYGVVVGKDDEWIYVQISGFVQVERIGLSSVSVGDKITADNNGILEINGSGDTFGVVVCATSNYGSYFKIR